MMRNMAKKAGYDFQAIEKKWQKKWGKKKIFEVKEDRKKKKCYTENHTWYFNSLGKLNYPRR